MTHDTEPRFKAGETVYVMDYCPYMGAGQAQVVESAGAGKWRVTIGGLFRDVPASDLQRTVEDATRDFEARRDAIAQGFRDDADEIASRAFRLATLDEINDMPGYSG